MNDRNIQKNWIPNYGASFVVRIKEAWSLPRIRAQDVAMRPSANFPSLREFYVSPESERKWVAIFEENRKNKSFFIR